MIEVPEHAFVNRESFVHWLALQAIWEVLPLAYVAPYLSTCPLCAAVVANNVDSKCLHAAFHAALVEFS